MLENSNCKAEFLSAPNHLHVAPNWACGQKTWFQAGSWIQLHGVFFTSSLLGRRQTESWSEQTPAWKFDSNFNMSKDKRSAKKSQAEWHNPHPHLSYHQKLSSSFTRRPRPPPYDYADLSSSVVGSSGPCWVETHQKAARQSTETNKKPGWSNTTQIYALVLVP